MFSGVFHLFALRKRLDIGDSPYAVIPTQFQVVAARLSCEQWYLFLYPSVFYTINHLDIYRYVLRYLFISLLCTHFIAKHMVFTGSENKFWIFETQHYIMHFSDIFRQENQRFPDAFESAKWSICSIIQQFSLTVNSTKTIVFLVLRIRCQVRKWFEFVAYWCFPVAKDCFERSFPSKIERFLPFSRTENA